MRKIKIVADSSANIRALEKIPFGAAPLKIITAEGEFVDDGNLNVEEMIDFFAQCKGKSKTFCPNPGDWLDALLQNLAEAGLQKGKVRIAHCRNENAANLFAQRLHSRFPEADIQITKCLGLCSYYAEQGGMLVGFEKF